MRIVTGSQIENFLRSQGVHPAKTFIADRDYTLPDEEWLCGTFAKALKIFFKALRIFGWIAEQSDCDDFARGAAFLASVLHNITSLKRRLPKTALAFGEFWYHDKGAFDHAINCGIVSREGEEMRLLFYEPQNALKNGDPKVQLNAQEKNLCLGYRF